MHNRARIIQAINFFEKTQFNQCFFSFITELFLNVYDLPSANKRWQSHISLFSLTVNVMLCRRKEDGSYSHNNADKIIRLL